MNQVEIQAGQIILALTSAGWCAISCIRRKLHITRTLPVALTLLILANLGQTTAPTTSPASRPTLPFTLSKQTTAITSPLKPDGTPDYVAALNQKLSKDVTPENNGFVLWVQVVGSDHVVNPKVKNRVLKMSGSTETPSDAQVWELYSGFLKCQNAPPPAEGSPSEPVQAGQAPWKPEDHPLVAAFLKQHDGLLTRAAQSTAKPHWWVPFGDPDGFWPAYTVHPSYPAGIRDVGIAFCACATLRAQAGDFNGFLADLIIAKQFARIHAAGASTEVRLIGFAIDAQASKALGAVAASGSLTSDQCTQAEKILTFPPLPSMADFTDTYERWEALELAQTIALQRKGELLAKAIAVSPIYGDIKPEIVDWDALLKHVNQETDQVVAAIHAPTMPEFMQAQAGINQRWTELSVRFADGNSRVSAAIYSERIGNFLFTQTISRPHPDELRRRAALQEQLTHAILAAAEFKAKTGNWPKFLPDLVPDYLKQIPKDLYSEGELSDIRYDISPRGIRIYSIGRDPNDDLSVGVK